MGFFDPAGQSAQATMAGLDANLAVPAGAGWSRNDDRVDHPGTTDLSPWGGEYDSAEWVVTDLRGAVAARLMGDTMRSERLIKWVRDQASANYLEVAETYDENTGEYKFNAPMVGFGAGVFALAVAARDGLVTGPACGAYYEQGGAGGAGGGGGGGGASSASSSAATGGGGVGAGGLEDGDCGCGVVGAAPAGRARAQAAWALLAAAAGVGVLVAGRRRRQG